MGAAPHVFKTLRTHLTVMMLIFYLFFYFYGLKTFGLL